MTKIIVPQRDEERFTHIDTFLAYFLGKNKRDDKKINGVEMIATYRQG